MSEFREFLETEARRFGNKKGFAKAIGITPGRFSRLLRGEFSMEVVNCLRLAKVTGESPDRVLRLAKKSEIADLIQELYGRPSLTGAQRALLDRWGVLKQPAKVGLEAVLQELVPDVADPKEKKPKRKSA